MFLGDRQLERSIRVNGGAWKSKRRCDRRPFDSQNKQRPDRGATEEKKHTVEMENEQRFSPFRRDINSLASLSLVPPFLFFSFLLFSLSLLYKPTATPFLLSLLLPSFSTPPPPHSPLLYSYRLFVPFIPPSPFRAHITYFTPSSSYSLYFNIL